jgi:transcriptional regulator with XRE-family HTH domain
MTPQELRSRRVAIGISVGELAFEVRLPIRAVSEIENGNREVPHADVFLRALERLERGYVVRRDMSSSDS